jgi:hypothetical protein
MGDQGEGSMPDALPAWFTKYIQEQQRQSTTALENELQQIREQEKEAKEARLRMIRNDNKPGKALPPLLEFYGDADKLEAWLQQARAKMEVDYYGCTEFVKFWALNGSLRGKALRRMEAWVREQGTAELANGYSFLDRVEFVFRDPQAKERAQRKLEALRQGSKPFLEVFTEWQSLLMESGGSSWPDDAKKVSLDRILSDELVRAMITVPTQPDFESYCSVIKETDDRLRAYKSRMSKSKEHIVTGTPRSSWKRPTDEVQLSTESRNPSGPRVTRKASVESMDWESTPIRAAAASTRRAKWVSQEERDNRRQTGRCIRCGASGHIIRDCPYGPPQRPVQTATARQEKAKEVEPELDNKDIQSAMSEN